MRPSSPLRSTCASLPPVSGSRWLRAEEALAQARRARRGRPRDRRRDLRLLPADDRDLRRPRAVTLTGLWNQLLNLTFPIVALFLLSVSGEQSAALATAAFIGVAVLGVVIAGFVLILVSRRLAEDVGDLAARIANWALGKIHRGPVKWGGSSFE